MFKELGKEIIKEALKPKTTIGKIVNNIHRKPETTMDMVLKRNQEPAIGALIYCQLGPAEHSGIYLGKGRIAQLNGQGNIEIVSPKVFTNHITTIDTDIFIPVDIHGEPIPCYDAAHNTARMIGQNRNYNLILDNCHQFSAGCLSGDFENADNFLWMVKGVFKEVAMDKIDWGNRPFRPAPLLIIQATRNKVKWRRWKWYDSKF